jgi:hypothetical protein
MYGLKISTKIFYSLQNFASPKIIKFFSIVERETNTGIKNKNRALIAPL